MARQRISTTRNVKQHFSDYKINDYVPRIGVLINNFMREAINESHVALDTHEGGPFGAVVICGDEIVARAHNTVTSANDPTAHAEINAIRKACRELNTYDLSGCELYTSCEPCPMCLAAIYWSRMKTVYYANTKDDAARIGFDDSHFYEELSKPASERDINTVEIPDTSALLVFEKWHNMADKRLY